jgi:hypothetical protein
MLLHSRVIDVEPAGGNGNRADLLNFKVSSSFEIVPQILVNNECLSAAFPAEDLRRST